MVNRKRVKKVVLLGGNGYTGRVLHSLLLAQGHSVVSTGRSLEGAPPDRESSSIWFDLSNPSSWENIPASDWLAWLFPAEPDKAVDQIVPTVFAGNRRVVVVGTTSSFVNTGMHEELTEESPLDQEVPRVRGEELLRRHGANVLRSGGIYGPARNPLDWLRRGRVSLGNYVNLIHVEDLASAIVATLESPRSGAQFIVTDGNPRRWADIAAWAEEERLLEGLSLRTEASLSSRRYSNKRLVSEINPPFRHPDLFTELLKLEKSDSGHSTHPER